MTEIQGAITKLPEREKRTLSAWLSSQEKDGLAVWADKLAEMASDPQIRTELHQVDREFAATEADGLGQA